MRGVHSAVDDIRRNVFTEVARLAYEGGDLSRVDTIPYKMIQGEVAHHRHDVFLERAIVQERVRLALGMNLQPAREQEPQLAAQVQELQDKNNALRSDIAASGDPDKLEDVARSELGMVESGEKVFYETGS